jgi:EAL domain-containing protein (putative c-di-GMP-specific phosphodiesterase class I)
MHNYRRNGYGIAVNLARVDQASVVLAHLRPDFIKIDAGNLHNVQVATALATFAHDNGARLIVKRLGSRAHQRLALEAGVPLAQGHALDDVSPDLGVLASKLPALHIDRPEARSVSILRTAP